MKVIALMAIALLSLLAASGWSPHANAATDQEPSGYILRTGGQGSVVVVRGGKEMDVTGRRDFLLLPGDVVRTKGGAWVEYYLSSNRKVNRVPAIRLSTRVPSPAPVERRASRSIVAARRLGSPPEPANRLFAERRLSPYHVPSDRQFRLSAVTVSGDVRPVKATLVKVVGADRQGIDLDVAVDSKRQFHRLSWTLDEAVCSGLGRFDVRVVFSDGSADTATFEALSPRPGATGMRIDQLRRAATAYAKLGPESEEWFLALNDLAVAYEDLGCDAQAGNLILDWWFHEPSNPAAEAALLGLAIKFELGAIDQLFGPPIRK